MMVGEVHHRGPVIGGEGVAVFRVIDAEAVGGVGAEEGVGGFRGEDRLADGFRERDGVGVAFEGDEGARGAEGEEPVLIERELFARAPEFVQVGRKPVRYFFCMTSSVSLWRGPAGSRGKRVAPGGERAGEMIAGNGPPCAGVKMPISRCSFSAGPNVSCTRR